MSSGRRFSHALQKLLLEYETTAELQERARDVNDAVDEAVQRFSASRLFLESPTCLYLCMSDEARQAYQDRVLLETSSYANFEGYSDPWALFRLTGVFAGWLDTGLPWTYPGFTLLATFGYSSYLLFYATQRFTLLWLLLTLESAVIHLSIISQIQILYTDRSGRFEEICRDQQQRYVEFVDFKRSVSARQCGLTLALASRMVPLAANDDTSPLEPDFETELWQRAVAWKLQVTLLIVSFISIISANVLAAFGGEVVSSSQVLFSTYSTLHVIPVLEICAGALATVHIFQFQWFTYSACHRMVYMNCDMCLLADHVTQVLRKCEFNELEDARISSVAHLLRRLLTLARESCEMYSKEVVVGVDVDIALYTLAVSFGLLFWGFGSEDGCVPTWVAWHLAGGVGFHLLFFTATGCTNIYLRRLTPIIQEKHLEAVQKQSERPTKYKKIATLLQVCADMDKFMATYHGVSVTPQAMVYLWGECGVFFLILAQIVSFAPSNVFTSRFLVCNAEGHMLPWPPSDLSATNSSNVTSFLNSSSSAA